MLLTKNVPPAIFSPSLSGKVMYDNMYACFMVVSTLRIETLWHEVQLRDTSSQCRGDMEGGLYPPPTFGGGGGMYNHPTPLGASN